MSSVVLIVRGILIHRPGWTALHLDDGGARLCLRFALVLREGATLLFPEVLLDDWGHEIASLDLYRWIINNGDRFPRAEIFGNDAAGKARQCFLREIELTERFPCFAYISPKEELADGVMITHALVTDASVQIERSIPAPRDVNFPLSVAMLRWWAIPPGGASRTSFMFLDQNHIDIK